MIPIRFLVAIFGAYLALGSLIVYKFTKALYQQRLGEVSCGPKTGVKCRCVVMKLAAIDEASEHCKQYTERQKRLGCAAGIPLCNEVVVGDGDNGLSPVVCKRHCRRDLAVCRCC